MKVDNILIEYLNNPIGIGIKSPRITWNDFDITKQDSFEVFYKVNGVSKTSGIIKSSSMNYIFKSFKVEIMLLLKLKFMMKKEIVVIILLCTILKWDY